MRYFEIPFANTGDRVAIPNDTQIDGSLSYEKGWTSDYEKDLDVDVDAKAVSREATNQNMFDITENIKHFQEHGYPKFITTAENGGTPFSYAPRSVVYYNGEVYINPTVTTTATPPNAPWTIHTPTGIDATLTADIEALLVAYGSVADEAAASASAAADSATAAAASAANVVRNTHNETASADQTTVDVISSGFILASTLDDIMVFIDGSEQHKDTLTRTSDTVITLGVVLTGGEELELRSATFNPSASDQASASASASATSASASATSASEAATSASEAATSAAVHHVVTDLAADIASAGATETQLIIVDEQVLLADLSQPSNVTLEIQNGGLISGAFTLTLNGELIAGDNRIFGQSLTVLGLNLAKPEWWLENTTPGTTNMTVALNAAGLFPNVLLQDRSYFASDTIDFSAVKTLTSINAKILSNVSGKPAVQWIAGSGDILLDPKMIGHLTVDRSEIDWDDPSTGVFLQNVYHGQFNLSALGFHKGIWVHGYNKGCVYNNIYVGRIANCKYSTYLDSFDASGYPNQNIFHGGRYSGGVVGSPSSSTTVDSDSLAGQKIVYLTSTDGFKVGDSLLFSEGEEEEEWGEMAAVTVGVSITLVQDLKNDQTIGAAVITGRGSHIKIDSSMYLANGNRWICPSFEHTDPGYLLFDLGGNFNTIFEPRAEHGGDPNTWGILGGVKNTVYLTTTPYVASYTPVDMTSRLKIVGLYVRLFGANNDYHDKQGSSPDLIIGHDSVNAPVLIQNDGAGPALQVQNANAGGSSGLQVLNTDGTVSVDINASGTSWLVKRNIAGTIEKRILWTSTAAPASGTYNRGDIAWMTNPSAGGNVGWVCVSGGTPGTWKAFGTIEA